MRRPEAVELAASLLTHWNTSTRLLAARVLLRHDDTRGTPVLLDALQQTVDEETRTAAVKTLHEITDPAMRARFANPILVWKLLFELSTGDMEARCFAADLLGVLAVRQAEGPLVKMLDEEPALLRLAAIEALSNLNGAQSDTALQHALRDNASRVQEAAARALGHRKAKSAIPSLITVLDTPATRVRSAAAQALHAITGQAFGEDMGKWQTWWSEEQRIPAK